MLVYNRRLRFLIIIDLNLIFFYYFSGYIFESDEYWECWIRHLASTDHHPVGTCKMGSIGEDSNESNDPMAVVSYKSLKVRGIKNVRVVDASIMPNVPSKSNFP